MSIVSRMFVCSHPRKGSLFLRFWLGASTLAVVTTALLFGYIGWALGANIQRGFQSAQFHELAVRLASEVGPILTTEHADQCNLGLELYLRRLSEEAFPRAYTLDSILRSGNLIARIVINESVVCSFPDTYDRSLDTLLTYASAPSVVGSVVHTSHITDDGNWAVALTIPQLNASSTSQLQIGVREPPFWDTQIAFHVSVWRWLSPYVFLTSIAIGILVAFALVYTLLKRIRHAERIIQDWTTGNLDSRIEDNSNDEFGRLCASFNRMATNFQMLIRKEQELAGAEERNNLARDLHDTAKQRSFALNLILTSLSRLPYQSEEHHRLTESARRLTKQLQKDLSAALNKLVNPSTIEQGVEQALRETLDQMFGIGSIRCDMEIARPVLVYLDNNREVSEKLLALATEGAANILRHSYAKHCSFTLQKQDDRILFYIWDDGVGFDTNLKSFGKGLTNMEHRAKELPDSRYTIQSSPGHGTRIFIDFYAY